MMTMDFGMQPALRLLLAWLALCLPALAQDPAASASFTPEVGTVGRPVEYRVTITSEQRVVDLPNMVPPPGLDFQPGGTFQRLVQLNGQIVSVNTLVYTALPTRPGDYEVKGFEVEVDGQKVRVPPARITVNPLAPGEQAYQPLRVMLEMPPREFYVGETVTARLLFLSTPDETVQFIQHISKSTGDVIFKPARSGRPVDVMVDGKPVSGLAMPVEITAVTEGEHVISCEAVVQLQKRDPIARRGGIGTQSTVQSAPARFKVLGLPKVGRLPGFTGGIGQFSMTSPKVTPTETQVGEAVTLSFSISGEGNLESLPPPELGEVPNWTVYKPGKDFSQDDETGRAVKTFTFTMVPKVEGRRSTPPIPFSYFDPVKRDFQDLTVPPVSVLIAAAPGTPPGAAGVAVQDVPAAPGAQELAPAEPPPALTGLAETSGRWVANLTPSFRLFWWGQALPPVLLALLWGWRRRREYLAAHPEILLRRRARAAARKALGEARAAAQRGDAPAFLRAGTGALCEAAAHVDTARAHSLTPAEVLELLQGEAAQAAREIFHHADSSRYAAAAGASPQPSALLPGLERAVATLTARA